MSLSLAPAPHADAMLDAARAALEQHLRAEIPLTRTIDLRVTAYDGDTVSFSAPLAPNINDKGCAFGGSLASVLTLTGWGLIKLAADLRDEVCDIYVQDSSIRYLAPVWGDFVATAQLDAGDDFPTFFTTLRTRGKGRLTVRSEIRSADGAAAAVLTARFVAIAGKRSAALPDTAQSAIAS